MADSEQASSPASTSSRRGSGNGARRASRSSHARDGDIDAQVARLQDDLKSITQTLTKMGESRVGEARNAARSQVENLVERGQHAVEDAQDEFSHLENQIKDKIRERPLIAIAGAVAVGFVLAIVTR